MAEKISKILSPCISICQYDENGTCFGCLRTLKERKKWKKSETSNMWKEKNLNEIKERMQPQHRKSWEDTYIKKIERVLKNEKS